MMDQPEILTKIIAHKEKELVERKLHMPLEKFVESWNQGSDKFKEDPPNATLSVLDSGRARNVVFELLSAEMKDGSLNFKVEVLEGRVNGAFGPASLFLDSSGQSGPVTFL